MTLIEIVILSIIEGLTEFLPISSTGHLILGSKILGLKPDNFLTSFEIFIQLGAILAICFLYFNKLFQQINLWKNILTAFIPSALIGFLFYKMIKHYLLTNPFITISSLFTGGVILLLLEILYLAKKPSSKNIFRLSWKDCLIIGIFQSASVIPGVSRAAATIIGGLITGLSRKEAVEFSFLLAVPTMFAATSLDIYKSNFNFSFSQIQILIAGFIISFLTALIAVKYFLLYIQKNNFVIFAIYRIIISFCFLLFI